MGADYLTGFVKFIEYKIDLEILDVHTVKEVTYIYEG